MQSSAKWSATGFPCNGRAGSFPSAVQSSWLRLFPVPTGGAPQTSGLQTAAVDRIYMAVSQNWRDPVFGWFYGGSYYYGSTTYFPGGDTFFCLRLFSGFFRLMLEALGHSKECVPTMILSVLVTSPYGQAYLMMLLFAVNLSIQIQLKPR